MVMTKRLLDRQASLLDYLSGAGTIFGSRTNSPAAPALRAFDPGVLCLQARFICNKRIEKIVAVFPRTLRIAGPAQSAILREFVLKSRPTRRGTLANAREFHEFLLLRWHRSRPRPAYLRDVAACELAIAEARHVGEDHEETVKAAKSTAEGRIRRRRNVIPLRCAHDIRATLNAGPGEATPLKRAISLIVSVSADFDEVKIVEAPLRIVEALSLLEHWADARALDQLGDREKLLSELIADELIEKSG